MAFQLIPGPTPTYLYRQSDTVPVAGIVGGSVAINLDTQDVSDFDASIGQWVKRSMYYRDLDPNLQAANVATTALILRELRLIRRGMIAATNCLEYDGDPAELDEQPIGA